MDREISKAELALNIIATLDNHRFSAATGDPVDHSGTEKLRANAIAYLESVFATPA